MPRGRQFGCVYILGLAVLVLFVFCSNAAADTVHLKNGNAMVGIITRATDTEIEMQVCEEGTTCH